jgi:hypothetical protein
MAAFDNYAPPGVYTTEVEQPSKTVCTFCAGRPVTIAYNGENGIVTACVKHQPIVEEQIEKDALTRQKEHGGSF